jgi:hypothetical protein
VVRFGEVGHADLYVELTGSPRVVYVEAKHATWKAPSVPKFGCCASTMQKYRHHLDQVAFLEGQRKRGNVAFFARSPIEVYHELLKAGFHGLPVPQETPKAIPRPSASRSSR